MVNDPNAPFKIEQDGTFITNAQMRFFLNSLKGEDAWHERRPAFKKYSSMCRVYNLITEVLEINPTAAIIYWNADKGNVSVSFPVDGAIANEIQLLKLLEEADYKYDPIGDNWVI